jgi:MOSC domain-containing protein YiiM
MNAATAVGRVAAVSLNRRHQFTKQNQLSIRLVTGHGVEGDAHFGTTVQHLYRGVDPTRANLRQVHLMQEELFGELHALGFPVAAGDLGENITTRGLDLLALPAGTLLHLGDSAIVEVTGLRKPCFQIDRFRQGLREAVTGRDAERRPILKSGIMSVVVSVGEIRPGDPLVATLPPTPHRPLAPV